MPSRPDLRDIATNVREAFADADRETLLDILTFVVKEYVVEGPPPMLIHQAETLSDLQGSSFAQLITALQTRFDHPELAMFVVDGDQVSVRIGNAVHPLLPARQPIGGTAADVPRPAAGVHVVETTLSPRPPASQPAAASAPPPRAGISLRSQPTVGGPAAPSSPAAPSPAAPPSPPPAASAAPSAAPQPSGGDKSEPSADDASARFSLLELD